MPPNNYIALIGKIRKIARMRLEQAAALERLAQSIEIEQRHGKKYREISQDVKDFVSSQLDKIEGIKWNKQ